MFGDSLHQSLMRMTDPNDISLDLEISLLRSGIDPCKKNRLERTALHCLFVGGSNSQDQVGQDPVEMCSVLLEKMDDESVGTVDQVCSVSNFSPSTPLKLTLMF